MRVETSTRIVWIVLASSSLQSVGAQICGVLHGHTVDTFSLGMLSFPVVGALIVSRQPGNAVGRIMLGIGAGQAFAAAIGLSAV